VGPGDVGVFHRGRIRDERWESATSPPSRAAVSAESRYTVLPARKPTMMLRSIDAWDAIKVSGARHIVIQGFRVMGKRCERHDGGSHGRDDDLENPRTCGNGIGITSDRETKAASAYITVRNCEVSDFPGGGIFANHVDYLTFENNVVYRCAFWSPFGNSGLSVYQPTAIDDSAGYKIFIRNNVCFENYQNIPFFFSNRNDPSKRKVTDGNRNHHR